jgi:hypothetical protein
MAVLIEICKKCNYTCNSVHYKCNFNSWTSDNSNIDKFIQSTQLSAHREISGVLEWISYDRLYNIKCVTKSNNFNDKMYIANWIDGYINKWDDNNQNWKRNKPNMLVILKIIDNPASITLEFIKKV